MTNPRPLDLWESAEFDFAVDVQAPKPRPRAWEREPKSPHASRHKGRKVWKRPASRAGLSHVSSIEVNEDVGRSVLGEVSTNTPRAVKKLRLKDAPFKIEAKDSKPSRSFTTLRDGNSGTPKRKHVDLQRNKPVQQRNFDKQDHYSPDPDDADTVNADQLRDNEESSDMLPIDDGEVFQAERVQDVESSAKEASIVDDQVVEEYTSIDQPRSTSSEELRDQQDPVVSKNDDLPEQKASSPMSQEGTAPVVLPNCQHNALVFAESVTPIVPTERDSAEEQEVDMIFDISSPSASMSQATQEAVVTPRTIHENLPVSSRIRRLNTSTTLATPEHKKIAESICSISHYAELETPQIGTTLLRRESLRRRESPSKKMSARKGRSPQKKQLKKRDTLQEREILQNFTEELGADSEGRPEILIEESDPCDPTRPTQDNQQFVQLENEDKENLLPDAGNDNGVIGVREVILDSDDMQKAIEAVDVCEDARQAAMLESSPQSGEEENSGRIAKASIAETGTDDMQQTSAAVVDKVGLPIRKTRSGARFSDDTSMLKDFLNRAQARKAAKGPTLSPRVPKSLQVSPKRSPRKRSNPVKSRDSPTTTGSRPGTPPSKLRFELDNANDADEDQAEEQASCRRSTRARLPAPAKTPLGAPSFIPVRRADGPDPVVLQKTEVQELAADTRNNTRRNRGKPTVLLLQDLPKEEAEAMAITRQGARKGKAVAWAEELASYHDSKEAAEEADDQRPKIRRIRGLGAPNGTPAAKRAAAVNGASNGTPAPKRRGRQQL